MLRPSRMKRFYVAVPQNKEEEVAEALGKLGFVELFSEKPQTLRGDVALDTYSAFIRIVERARLAYETIEDILPTVEEKLSFGERLKRAFQIPMIERRVEKVSVDDLKSVLPEYEERFSKYSSTLDSIRRRISEIDDLLVKIEVFRRHGIPLDTPGEYTHIFVKVGFIPEINIDRLKEALKPFNVVLTILEGRPKDKFVMIAASQKDKEAITNILTMLNMEEILLPEDIDPDPEKAYVSLLEEKNKLFEELEALKKELSGFIDELSPKLRYVRFMYRVRSMTLRTRNFSVFYGWVPKDKISELESKISEVTGGLMHLEAEDPDPESDVKPPTHLKHPPIVDKFQLIVRMRGTPSYYELDPTVFFTVLFSIMYGMMFGDVGQGIVLFILGQIFSRIKKPFLGISYTALNKLGGILSTASIFSIIFGFLYGESFLLHFMDPIWLNPLEDPIAISVVAIIFGLVQICIGLVLNIINEVMNKEYITALLSWKGLAGLVYYLIGIVLAVRFIIGGMRLEVFAAPENLPLVGAALGLLGIGFLKPTIENIIEKHGHPFSETLMEGVSEFIEMFLSYITNSISYVRLGAFAIAHVALAQVAHILAPQLGFVTAYLIFNVIVILIEGFSAGIQSIRLLFYEFSTKFYKNEGRPFRPLRI